MTSTSAGGEQPGPEQAADDDPTRTAQLRIPRHFRQKARDDTRGGRGRWAPKELPRYDYEHYSRLAGPAHPARPDQAVHGRSTAPCSRRSRTASGPR